MELIKNLEKETVLVLKDRLEYEEGQVVSVSLAQRPGVAISLMAFDEGEAIGTHAAPGDAFVTVLDGTGEYTIGGTAHVVQEGESIVMPVNIPHSVKALTKMKMLLVLVK